MGALMFDMLYCLGQNPGVRRYKLLTVLSIAESSFRETWDKALALGWVTAERTRAGQSFKYTNCGLTLDGFVALSKHIDSPPIGARQGVKHD